MESQKLKNLCLSLAVLAGLAALLFWLSGRIDPRSGEISPLFTWIAMIYFAALAAAAILFILRLTRTISYEINFFYTLAATGNFILGLAGVLLYFLQQVNLPTLHALLLSLLVGTILYTDIFFYEAIFNKKETTNHI